MSVSLHTKSFDPWALVATHQATVPAGRFGATAVFVGTMRDFNEGDDVRAMTLEHYPGMTEKHLEAIVAQARQRWTLEDCLIAHRVGAIEPGEPIVVTAVWSAHRGEAFEACRYLMEELKHRAPFWKRESLADGGTRWVERNTEG